MAAHVRVRFVLLVCVVVCASACHGSSPIVPTQTLPSQTSQLLPPQTPGFLSGTYLGSIPGFKSTDNGIVHTQTALSLKRVETVIVGKWQITDSFEAFGQLDGAFDPTRTDDGFGTLSIRLVSTPDRFVLKIEGVVTAADGSTFVGEAGDCGNPPDYAHEPCLDLGPVTFTRLD